MITLFSLLDIHGPSITVDTACSSGLIAVHEGMSRICFFMFRFAYRALAVRYLQSGEGESAIVCGANVHPWYISPHTRLLFFILLGRVL